MITDEMNKADNKKFDEMKPIRDGLIAKAQPTTVLTKLSNLKKIISER